MFNKKNAVISQNATFGTVFGFAKKGISPVVATALLLVVAVVAVVGFQGWYETFSSNLFVDAEQDSGNLDTSGIEGIIGDTLYLKAGNNLTVESIRIDGNDCNINGTYSGTQGLDISSCLENVSSSTPEIVLVTDDNVLSKSVYLDDKETQSLSNQNEPTLQDLYPSCYNSSNLNTIGTEGICQDMLIVNRSMLDNAIDNNISINGGSDYYIEFGGINYTFGNSTYNIFTGQITNMNSLFSTFSYDVKFNSDINYWETSSVTDMGSMFSGVPTFNQSLNNWDTSSVTNMQWMFQDATIFNSDISNWDTSSVTTFGSMFKGADSFNKPIGNWDTSSTTGFGMRSMFQFAYAFNQPLDNWDTSEITNMGSMFQDAISFNQPLNSWDVSKVTYMGEMFSGTENFSQPLDNWDVNNVTSMFAMFGTGNSGYSSSFNGNISTWNVSNVDDMAGMFGFNANFNQDIGSWDVSSVTDMGSSQSWIDGMFENATSFNQDLSSWNVSLVVDCEGFDLNANNWTLPSSRPALNASCLSSLVG